MDRLRYLCTLHKSLVRSITLAQYTVYTQDNDRKLSADISLPKHRGSWVILAPSEGQDFLNLFNSNHVPIWYSFLDMKYQH